MTLFWMGGLIYITFVGVIPDFTECARLLNKNDYSVKVAPMRILWRNL